MDRTYVLTPEMLGLTWSRLFRHALIRSAIYVLTATVLAALLRGYWALPVGAAVLGAGFDFILTFTARSYAPSRLRITDNRIEEIGGPIIRRHEVIAVNESHGEPVGIEVIGRRKPEWLPNYRIFIPATLAEFDELRQLLGGWSRSSQG